jgi:hypothetical protein
VAWDRDGCAAHRWCGPDDGCMCGEDHTIVYYATSRQATDQHGSSFFWNGASWERLYPDYENRSYVLLGAEWRDGQRWLDTGERRVR